MVNATNTKALNDGTFLFSFSGKSTDTKPTGVYKGAQIANGSTFLQLPSATEDMKVWFYDAEAGAWS